MKVFDKTNLTKIKFKKAPVPHLTTPNFLTFAHQSLYMVS